VDGDLGDHDVAERVAALVAAAGVTLVAGAPACQAFSHARSTMLREVVRTGRREVHDRRRGRCRAITRAQWLSGAVALHVGKAPTVSQEPPPALLTPCDRHQACDQIVRPVREDDAKASARMDHTTRYSELDADLKRYRDDIFDDKYKRLDANFLSRTITAHI